MKQLFLLLLLPLLLLAAVGVVWALRGEEGPTWRAVAVERGTLVQHAVAVGRIEPIFEIPVTTPSGGVVTARFVELGQRVKRDDPLLEVRPVLTDRQRLSAERALVAAREAADNTEDLVEGRNIMGRAMQLLQGSESMERMKSGAERQRSSAEESLTLLLEGSVQVEDRTLDWIVRAPTDGHVIELDVELGEPVVPASNFGSGTVLCVLADLERPVFRGTVDEIDAGRLRVDLPAAVTIGALPGATLSGKLREISLRGVRRDDAVSFPVVLDVEPPPELVLRSGYSAVARIEVARAEDALLLPERLVRTSAGRSTVLVDSGGAEPAERSVQLGLGDGLTVEIRDGLQAGDEVLEQVD